MFTSLLSSRFASLEWYEPGLTAKSKEARPGECNICSHMFLCLIFRLVYGAQYAGRWKDSQDKADVVTYIGEREAKKRRYI